MLSQAAEATAQLPILYTFEIYGMCILKPLALKAWSFSLNNRLGYDDIFINS